MLLSMSDNKQHAAVQKAIADIEAEMKKVGMWQAEALSPELFGFQEAFGMDTMAFSQWLQFVFVPNVRKILLEEGEFPSQSWVGVQAMREFDGFEEAGELVRLLSDFDAMFEE